MTPNLRFWESTKGRIVSLLRSGSRTVNELATALRLTDNAVRAQLMALERDGLVRTSGTRPGARKPHTTYVLTAEAGQLFPKAYGPVLRVLLDVLKQRVSKKQLLEIVKTVGQKIAPSFSTAQRQRGQTPQERALAVLHELGGFCEEEAEKAKSELRSVIVLRCGDCPLAMVVAHHSEGCKLIETILSEVLELPVQERCRLGPVPQCMFEIGSN